MKLQNIEPACQVNAPTINTGTNMGGCYEACGPFIIAEPVVVDATQGGTLPTEFNKKPTKAASVDVITGDSDFTIPTNYTIEGLVDGAMVRIRKIDEGYGKIKFVDPQTMTYSYINRRSEFITMLWSKDSDSWSIW